MDDWNVVANFLTSLKVKSIRFWALRPPSCTIDFLDLRTMGYPMAFYFCLQTEIQRGSAPTYPWPNSVVPSLGLPRVSVASLYDVMLMLSIFTKLCYYVAICRHSSRQFHCFMELVLWQCCSYHFVFRLHLALIILVWYFLIFWTWLTSCS